MAVTAFKSISAGLLVVALEQINGLLPGLPHLPNILPNIERMLECSRQLEARLGSGVSAEDAGQSVQITVKGHLMTNVQFARRTLARGPADSYENAIEEAYSRAVEAYQSRAQFEQTQIPECQPVR